jgi:hypothetical protein
VTILHQTPGYRGKPEDVRYLTVDDLTLTLKIHEEFSSHCLSNNHDERLLSELPTKKKDTNTDKQNLRQYQKLLQKDVRKELGKRKEFPQGAGKSAVFT